MMTEKEKKDWLEYYDRITPKLKAEAKARREKYNTYEND